MKVDVIIVTYRPGKKFLKLVESLKKQTVEVNKIIVMNTEEKYWGQLIYGSRFLEQHHSRMDVYHLSKSEFDHGRTRNLGIAKSDADICILMTQDAVPADLTMVEHLIQPLCQESVAVSYARQLPAEDCSVTESYIRSFNYPENSSEKGIGDLGRLGIKTFFCSNVCAAYKRKIFRDLGGFINRTIFNEDMIFASRLLKSGYRIAYAADARVIHSHNYNNKEQFSRNFDLGVSQADHPEVFLSVPSVSEGSKLVRQTIRYLRDHGYKKKIPGFMVESAYRYLGYQAGKHYRRLSRKTILRFTMNREYWRNRV